MQVTQVAQLMQVIQVIQEIQVIQGIHVMQHMEVKVADQGSVWVQAEKENPGGFGTTLASFYHYLGLPWSCSFKKMYGIYLVKMHRSAELKARKSSFDKKCKEIRSTPVWTIP